VGDEARSEHTMVISCLGATLLQKTFVMSAGNRLLVLATPTDTNCVVQKIDLFLYRMS
jgi:hypothetical protein